MPSHLVEVLFQGVWSSLTGGWFYDTHLSLFINTVHMYTWFFLFALPFVFYIVFPSTLLTWLVYTTIVSLLFTLVKLVNHQLNKMFDNNKITTTEKTVQVPRMRKPDKRRLKLRKPEPPNNNSNSTNSGPGMTNLIRLTSLSPNNRAQTIRPRNLRQRQASANNATANTHRKTTPSSIIDDTAFESDAFDTNSMLVDYSLESESASKSKRPKAYSEAASKRRRQTTRRSYDSKPNTSAAFQMEDDLLDAFLANTTTPSCDKANIPVVGDSEPRSIELTDTYFRSLSSPSKLTCEKTGAKRGEYEPVDYLMIDLEFNYHSRKRLQEHQKLTGNLSDAHLKGMTGSLNLNPNHEAASNRSLFKISEESLNNVPMNSVNNYMYISSKSANELKSKLVSRGTRSNRNETFSRRYKRIYSTIDSPKLAKKQIAKKKLQGERRADSQETNRNGDDDTRKESSASMTCIDLFDSYENSGRTQQSSENYYDIAATATTSK